MLNPKTEEKAPKLFSLGADQYLLCPSRHKFKCQTSDERDLIREGLLSAFSRLALFIACLLLITYRLQLLTHRSPTPAE